MSPRFKVGDMVRYSFLCGNPGGSPKTARVQIGVITQVDSDETAKVLILIDEGNASYVGRELFYFQDMLMLVQELD